MADFKEILTENLTKGSTSVTLEVQQSNESREDSAVNDADGSNLGNIEKKRKVEFQIASTKKSAGSETSNAQDHSDKCSSHSQETVEGSDLMTETKTNAETSLEKGSSADLQTLLPHLSKQHNLDLRCKSALTLAALCLSEELPQSKTSECLNALQSLTDSHEIPNLTICHALLLCSLTKKSMTLEQKIMLESCIYNLASFAIKSSDGKSEYSCVGKIKLKGLSEENNIEAHKLCQKLFSENLDPHSIDVSAICCSSLRNLSMLSKAHGGAIDEKFIYADDTLRYILGITGKSTQQIVSEKTSGMTENNNPPNSTSYTVNQCLQVIEHALTVDSDIYCQSLEHEDFSVLHCLTRLLEWCMRSLFKEQNGQLLSITQKSLSTFHLSTLVSVLKILSVLSFNPDQYVTFANVKGLMERIMICAFKAYFHSEGNHFDVLVLCLELMINLFIKHQKIYALLCLKKFQISDGQDILAIEAFLKILSNSLEKINELKSKHPDKSEESRQNNDSNKKELEESDRLVIQAAEHDMELSTIVSFVSILIAFFMDIKQSFMDFIRERLPSEKSAEALVVCKKFLQFASLTGGMPATGILLLRHAIKKLYSLYPPINPSPPVE